MKSITVNISDDDEEFLEDNNIDIDDVVSHAIKLRRREWIENNPIPEVSQSVLNSIESVHHMCNSGDRELFSFREGLPRARVSIGAMVKEEGYEVSVHINRLDDIPDGEFSDVLSNSGEFLSEISTQLKNKLKSLNNTGSISDFKLDNIQEGEFKKSAKYTIRVEKLD